MSTDALPLPASLSDLSDRPTAPQPNLLGDVMMTAFQSSVTAIDWIVLGLLTAMVLFIALGIRCLRQEIQATARVEAKSARLKTTGAQRQRWRQGSPSQELIALLDDIDTLLE